jgi:hypothetical protein
MPPIRVDFDQSQVIVRGVSSVLNGGRLQNSTTEALPIRINTDSSGVAGSENTQLVLS